MDVVETPPTGSDPRRSGGTRRRANQALLILLPLATATGLVANALGARVWPVPAAVHGAVALAIMFLTPWKAPIVRRGLRRPSAGRAVSMALLLLVGVALASGLLHSTGLTTRLGPFTVMQVHIGSAVIATLLVLAHYRRHPVSVRRTDMSRRSFLSASALGVVGAAAWLSWEGLLDVTRSRGRERRFTGSHERGSFNPAAMPVTSWLDDDTQHIEPGSWAVGVDGRPISLDQLEALVDEEFDALLDCTSGWYSEQRWAGVRLSRLVSSDRRSVSVSSATGYTRRFPARDLDQIWLVTSVGGEPLSAGHGFPARIVAPGRRGFWWIKWVTEIRTSDVPWWLQLPFPLS